LRIVDQRELREMEPEISLAATAALFAEDAGTIIPYEFCIAVAENAVDNGVELKIRRDVTGIRKVRGDKDDFLEVTAMHWEPESYARRQATVNEGSGLNSLAMISTLAGVAGGLYLLMQSGRQIPSGGEANVWMSTAAAATILLVTFFALRWFLPRKNEARNKDRQVRSTALPIAEVSPVRYAVEPSRGTVLQGLAQKEVYRARYVVNCAGTKSDTIAALVGDRSFTVKERLGDYLLLHKREGKRVRRTIFPCPGPLGKGVLVQNTLWGNLILGPTARDIKTKDPITGEYVPDTKVLNEPPESIVQYIVTKCQELVPTFNAKEVIHTFSGARAKTTRGDWVLERCATEPRLIHAAGIDSPGLAGAPAIALEVLRLLQQEVLGSDPLCQSNTTFCPTRAPIVMPKKGLKDALGNALVMTPVATRKTKPAPPPDQNIICKCEKVTEAEVVEAIRRSLPVDNTQAVRRRTRAGQGHCQGDPENYDCEQRVVEIIARELGIPESEVGRRPWPASSILPRRILSEADRQAWIAKAGV